MKHLSNLLHQQHNRDLVIIGACIQNLVSNKEPIRVNSQGKQYSKGIFATTHSIHRE